MITTYKELDVYKRSFSLAMEIFWLTRQFPKNETYSLSSQIVKSSRSISANITEGWAKRKYEDVFKKHLIDPLGSAAEKENWLEFAFHCKYINDKDFQSLMDGLEQIGKMLNKLHQNWTTYEK